MPFLQLKGRKSGISKSQQIPSNSQQIPNSIYNS